MPCREIHFRVGPLTVILSEYVIFQKVLKTRYRKFQYLLPLLKNDNKGDSNPAHSVYKK